MIYKLIKTDLWLNRKLYHEGAEIEVSNEDAKSLSKYLIPVKTKSTTKTETVTKKK